MSEGAGSLLGGGGGVQEGEPQADLQVQQGQEVTQQTPGQLQPEPVAVTTQQQVSLLSKIVNDDLTWKENWRSSLADSLGPEDPRALTIKGSESLSKYKTLPDALNALDHAQRAMGADKVVKPTANSPAEVWDEFYRAGGRPQSINDYDVKFSEDLNISPEREKQVRELLFQTGLNNKQAQTYIDFYEQDQLANLKAQKEATDAQIVESREILGKNWGEQLNARLGQVTSLIDNLGIRDVVEDMGLGRRHEFIEAMYKVASQFSESNDLLGTSGPIAPVDAQSKIDEVMKDPSHPFHSGNPEALKYMESLFKSLAMSKR